MLVDIFCGTDILSEWAVVWLGLPILAHSGANPWIYAFHHGEMRIAAGKIAQDLVALFGVMPGRYGCSPTRYGTNTNLELAAVNNEESNESRRRYPPVEDCFAAAKHHHNVLYGRRCLEVGTFGSRHSDISSEKHDIEYVAASPCNNRSGDMIEENIHDLTKMLDPRYIVDRNHVIDSNHNIDKIKNLKYLLDPTFNKIRHLRRLNHKRMNGKSLPLISEPKFISYQNLKSDGAAAHSGRKFLQLNALSDPILNVDERSIIDTKDSNQVTCRANNVAYQRRNPNLSLTMSDSNLRAVTVLHASEAGTRLFPTSDNGYSVQNLNRGYENALARHTMMLRQQMEDQQRCGNASSSRSRPKSRGHFGRVSPKHRLRNGRSSTTSSSAMSNNVGASSNPKRSVSPGVTVPRPTITSNKLANLINLDPPSKTAPMYRRNLTARTMTQAHKNLEVLKHSESTINVAIGDSTTHRVTLLEPSNLMDSLIVPTIHSEPPSPIDPLPSAILQAEEARSLEIRPRPAVVVDAMTQQRVAKSPFGKRSSPVRRSDPTVPTDFLLNIEDLSEPSDNQIRSDLPFGNTLEPIDLFETLLRNSDKSRDTRLPESIFAEHDSTRFSSRRPSDSKWSESSRSQEILSNAMEHETAAFPSSYSVNNFQTCNSGSDLNDLTSLFMCPDALTSSLRESLFSAPSMPDSDIFTSFEESDEPAPVFTPDSEQRNTAAYNSPVSTVNPNKWVIEAAFQSRSTESVHRGVRYPSTRSCAILKLEPAVHSSRLLRPCADYILKEPPPVKRNLRRLAPLAIPTPTDICTPTFDGVVTEIRKSDNASVGVKV